MRPGDLIETDVGLVAVTGCASWPLDEDWNAREGRGAQICGLTETGETWVGRWLVDAVPAQTEAA